MKWTFGVALSVVAITTGAWASGTIDHLDGWQDLPPCENTDRLGQLSVGVVGDPNPHWFDWLSQWAWSQPSVELCQMGWRDVVPTWMPWAHGPEHFYGFVVFALMAVLSLVVLYHFTPKDWWKKPNLFNVLAWVGSTWLASVVFLAVFHGLGGQRLFYPDVVAVREANSSEVKWLEIKDVRSGILSMQPYGKVDADLAQGSDEVVRQRMESERQQTAANTQGVFKTRQRLYLRKEAGVQAGVVRLLAYSERVTYDGKQSGDWWQVHTAQGESGWVSSLWLKRVNP